MDSTTHPIDPTFTANAIITSFSISVISITLFTSVTISITFYDAGHRRIDRVYLDLTGNDYAAWTDDSYLVTYVTNYITNTYPPSGDPPPPPIGD